MANHNALWRPFTRLDMGERLRTALDRHAALLGEHTFHFKIVQAGPGHRITICRLDKLGILDPVGVGYALKSPEDSDDWEIGAAIALGRALEDAGYRRLSEDREPTLTNTL